MDDYLKELQCWIDEDGLIGNKKFPEKWSSGNAILETSFAIHLIEKNESVIIPKLYLDLKRAILNCKSENGLFNKNPGRLDQITHDCLIGAAASSVEAARQICHFGMKNNWVMSNTGKLYWNAISRPQNIAFYKYASGLIYKPTWYQKLMLNIDLEFIPNDPSGLRLHYLKTYTLRGFSDYYEFLYQKTLNKINTSYKSLSDLMFEYYQNERHPFVLYFEGGIK